MDINRDTEALSQMLAKWKATLEGIEAELRDLEIQREVIRARKKSAEKVIDHLAGVLGGYQQFRDDGLLGASDQVAEAEQKTHFERVVAYLLSVDNAAQTMAQIEEGTGIPRSSLTAVLYRTHRDRFHMRESPGKQPNTWSLKGRGTGDDADESTNGEPIPF